jgi:hypothetical protein
LREAPRLEGEADHFNRLFHGGHQRQWLFAQCDRSARQPGHTQQIINEPDHLRGPAVHQDGPTDSASTQTSPILGLSIRAT